MFEKENPYLSIVAFSRNDNHGGNMLERMQMSLNSLLEQLEKYHIESELILVEWNPPADKPLLKEDIKWPFGLKYCTIRDIQVPSSIHQRYKYSDKIPMNVICAINCGIRRARGEFILPRPIDLLYPDELMSYIASKTLKMNELYRVDRYDVNRDILKTGYNTLEKQLEYCKQNIIHIYHRNLYDQEGLPRLHTAACGDFQLMSKHYWNLLRGYREAGITSACADPFLAYASYAAGVKEVVLNDPIRVYHIDHDDKYDDRLKMHRPALHKFLSSPFRLIRPFIPKFISKKIVFLYQKLISRRSRSEEYGVPTLDYLERLDLARDIVAGKCSYILNDENWGLGQEILPEFIIRTADWDAE